MSALREAWLRLESWLSENTPADFAALRPPAGAGPISALERRLGFPLHPDLTELLRLRDGVRQETLAGAFFLNARLNNTERIEAEHHNHLTLVSRMADMYDHDYFEHAVRSSGIRNWVPIALFNSGTIIYVNHRFGEEWGTVGQFSPDMGFDITQLAPSLGELISGMTLALETLTPFKGKIPHLHETSMDGRLLEWI
ncbi:SMI1/KNR4 family protein [Actinomadura sp. WMMA1423]|uniref:SMI1/KNR4 family protein n=1 Tax=Actinomadura sp. WMMA1423 TaxID=2591108 RepID=UPI0011467372|nr:SMI1/KNR4 family protein [Actinomadura sp. WMMA1423]